MRLAASLGLPTAEVEITEFAGERLICVRRYDRVQVGGVWRRVHQEDLGQASGASPAWKYETQGGLDAAACAACFACTPPRTTCAPSHAR